MQGKEARRVLPFLSFAGKLEGDRGPLIFYLLSTGAIRELLKTLRKYAGCDGNGQVFS